MSIEGRIAGLFVYPVKGCAAVAVDSALLTERGLEHDRRWMLARPDGRALTQREAPRLALLRAVVSGDALELAFPGGEARVPARDTGDPVEAVIWGDRVEALAVDPRADAALSAWLGQPVRLVRFPERARRACDPAHAPSGSHTAFADGFPLLVTSEGSLAELNRELRARGAEPVPMERFRPNLVLAEVPPGAEDRASALELAPGVRLELVKRCDRCVVTTVDPATGRKTGKEPLATLARLRRNPATGGAWFGQNAVPRLESGSRPRLAVGAGCAIVA